MWNYVFYIISLSHKSSTDYTGLEYEIVTQFDQTDEEMKTNWIPDGEEGNYSPNTDIQRLIGIADKCLTNVETSLKKLTEKVIDFNKAAEGLAE